MIRRPVLALLTLFPILLAVAGCDIIPVEPQSIKGTYKSTTFIIPAPNDGPDDVGARGGFIELRLNDDGTTSGRQHIPYGDGTASDRDLNGTYTITGDTILFHIQGAIFFEPMHMVNDEIRTTEQLRRGSFELVLKKQP